MKRLSLDQIDVDTTVQPVSQNRMTDVRHVYPDLVPAAVPPGCSRFAGSVREPYSELQKERRLP